jgi:ABC-2 type transport system ATP-binding protein
MLKVESIWKSYDENPVLEDISFSVEKGEIVGLLGPNGAGKSTLMKILAGYHMADKGQVTINGYSIPGNSVKAKYSCGYLAEYAPVYEYMTIKEYLEFLLAAKGKAKNDILPEAMRLLELFKLTQYKNTLISKLSAGYKQRCALAGSLAGDISLLILDEPAKGLDPLQIVELRDILRSYSGSLTVLISSHILSEMELLCDRVLILNDGRLQYDTASEGDDKNISPVRLKAEISGKGDIERTLISQEAMKILSISSRGKGAYDVELEIDSAEYEENKAVILFDLLVKNSLRLHSLELQKKTLESIFLSITGISND